MTFVVKMRARLLLPLLLCLGAASCGNGLPEGATSVYLTIQNGAGLAVPDQLLVTASGDGTPIYTGERLPRSGTQIGTGADGLLGTVTIYVPNGVAELRAEVSGYQGQTKRAQGSVTVPVVAGRQVAARVVLQPFNDSPDGSSGDTGPGTDTGAGGDTGTGADAPSDENVDAGSGADPGSDGGAADALDAATEAVTPPDGGSPDSPGCGASSLSGRSEAPGGTIDLTAEGALDWRFWGPPGMVSYKRTAGDKISDYTMVGSGPASTHFRNAVAFSWSDGSPTLAVTGAADSLNVAQTLGSGASFTVPATANAQTLSVYLGGSNDTGLFEATLSDGCVAGYSASASNGRNDYNVVYRVTFKSAVPGTVLRLRWTMSAGFEAIGLFAATLN